MARINRLWLFGLLAGIGMVGGTTIVRANSILITPDAPSIVAGDPDSASDYAFTYTVVLDAGSQIAPMATQDFFVLADVNGYDGYTDTSGLFGGSADWTVSTSLVDPAIVAQLEPDQALVTDVRFTYTGGATFAGSLTGTVTIGTTLSEAAAPRFEAGLDQDSDYPTLQVSNGDVYEAPGQGAIPTPLPSAAWMGLSSLLGLAAIGLVVRRRRVVA